ncbi:MAG TPA: hypothetical protein VGI99_08365 [Gemmataceae bacterium]
MPAVVPYEERLNRDRRWALREGSMHFEKASAVYDSLERIAKRLDDLGIPYALVGGMAMFLHGYRRFTEDVDILMTRESLELIHERLEGLGYLPPFQGSKNLRDTENGVRIVFIISRGFSTTDIDGIKCLELAKLVELKLASGTAEWRLKDLADVQELIRVFALPADFAERLDPAVRESYLRLWGQVNSAPKTEM